MAKHINNMDELEKALQPTMQKMVDGMVNRVYETLNFFLQIYYDSYDPVFYRRQYDFLRSGFKVDVRIVRGKVVASVYIDTDYMSNYYGVSCEQVVTAMQYINYSQSIRIVLYVRNGRIIVILSYGMNSTLLRYECLMKHLS